MTKAYSDMKPTDFNNPGRETLVDSDVGNVGLALIALTREVWIMRDRMAVMEAVMAEKGIDISEEIDRYQPSAEMQAELKAEGSKLLGTVLRTLSGTSSSSNS